MRLLTWEHVQNNTNRSRQHCTAPWKRVSNLSTEDADESAAGKKLAQLPADSAEKERRWLSTRHCTRWKFVRASFECADTDSQS